MAFNNCHSATLFASILQHHAPDGESHLIQRSWSLQRLSQGLAAFAVLFSLAGAAHPEVIPDGYAAKRPSIIEESRLRLFHLHTGESIDVAYKRGGEYLPSGIAMLNHFLRDHRTDAEADYDPHEFDLLHSILSVLHRPNAVIDIVCGYRSPESNEYLRTLSPVTGVAEHSQHILSKAIDIRIPGVSTRRLRDAALSLGLGGVGYYPKSAFVHVDVGPVRQWQYGGRQMLLARGGRGHRGHHRRHSA